MEIMRVLGHDKKRQSGQHLGFIWGPWVNGQVLLLDYLSNIKENPRQDLTASLSFNEINPVWNPAGQPIRRDPIRWSLSVEIYHPRCIIFDESLPVKHTGEPS